MVGAWSFSEMITLWRRIYITVNGVAKKGEKRKGGKYKKETENGTMRKTGKLDILLSSLFHERFLVYCSIDTHPGSALLEFFVENIFERSVIGNSSRRKEI